MALVGWAALEGSHSLMALSNAEHQRRHRIKQQLLRKSTEENLLEIKEELALLRKSLTDLANSYVRMRDMIPDIIQYVKEALATPSLRHDRHRVATPSSLNGSSPEVPPPEPLLPNLFSFISPPPFVSPKKEILTPPKGLVRSLDCEFEEGIWALFLRHVGKGQALRAYRAARKIASYDQIRDALHRYAVENQTTELKFIPHPATWLNGQRWLDEEPKSNGRIDAIGADGPNSAISVASGPEHPLTNEERRRIFGLEPC